MPLLTTGRGATQAEVPDLFARRTFVEALGVLDDGDPDKEGELVGEGSVERDAFASPEESVLSIRDEAPGATDHEDPHTRDP